MFGELTYCGRTKNEIRKAVKAHVRVARGVLKSVILYGSLCFLPVTVLSVFIPLWISLFPSCHCPLGFHPLMDFFVFFLSLSFRFSSPVIVDLAATKTRGKGQNE